MRVDVRALRVQSALCASLCLVQRQRAILPGRGATAPVTTSLQQSQAPAGYERERLENGVETSTHVQMSCLQLAPRHAHQAVRFMAVGGVYLSVGRGAIHLLQERGGEGCRSKNRRRLARGGIVETQARDQPFL